MQNQSNDSNRNETNDLIPFNLEKALAGEKVITRDGREVTQLTWVDFRKTGTNRLIGVVTNNDVEWFGVWEINGKNCANRLPHRNDLVMAPKQKIQKSGWMGIYTHTGLNTLCNTGLFDSKQEVKQYFEGFERKRKVLSIQQIFWEEDAE